MRFGLFVVGLVMLALPFSSEPANSEIRICYIKLADMDADLRKECESNCLPPRSCVSSCEKCKSDCRDVCKSYRNVSDEDFKIWKDMNSAQREDWIIKGVKPREK